MSLPKFCLASGSPRRQEMLTWLGLDFHIQPADVDESQLPEEPADEYVWRLAGQKAQADAACAQAGEIILAADTTVAINERILGKPASPNEASEMLRELRGRNHEVYTAIALFDQKQNWLMKDLCCSEVPMRNYSDAEIAEYVASGDPLDKAGAYAIQHAGFHPVERFGGCFASVMGMPFCHLKRSLAAMGYDLPADTFLVCRDHLAYDCPIQQQVLHGSLEK
jgi:septum formation protein